MLGVFLVFNYPMIIQAKTFLAGFGRELTEVTVGQHGVRKTQVPHIAYLRFLYNNFPLWYWPILGGYFFLAWRLPNRQRMEYLFPALIALAVLGMISFSPKISEKYMMPAEIFVLFAICAAVGVLAKWCPVRFPWMGSSLAVILVGLIVREQWQGNTAGRSGLKDAKDSFATNSYQILNDWILSNLPTTAILLQPEKRFLPDPEIGFFDDIPKKFPQKIYSQSTFVKSGSISSARAVGVTHVVVLYGTTKKYEGKVVSATQEAIIDRTRSSEFFNELLQNSRLVYRLEPRKNILLHPGFEIYELNSPSST